MKFQLNSKYRKNLEKLNQKIRNKVYETLSEFIKNPFNPILRNHELHGKMQNRRSIAVTGDIRIIFVLLKEDYTEILLLDIGSHSQLYS